jgi:penicillin-binding protein 1C
VAGHRLLLDGRDIGDAGARAQLRAGPGMHRLALIDPAGRVIDRVRFTIR